MKRLYAARVATVNGSLERRVGSQPTDRGDDRLIAAPQELDLLE